MSNRTLLAYTMITGQGTISLFAPLDETHGTYLVSYVMSHSEEDTTYSTFKAALNGYNQVCLRAETSAGWHE